MNTNRTMCEKNYAFNNALKSTMSNPSSIISFIKRGANQ